MPFALRSADETELDCLEKLGIAEKVSYSEWATPIVPVVKGVWLRFVETTRSH